MTVQEVTGIRRRSLVRGAAWTAPIVVIGVASPAYAASRPCEPVTVTLTEGTQPTQLSFPNSGVTATVAVTATKNGQPTDIPGTDPDGIRLTGGVSQNNLILFFDEPDEQELVIITMTITFSEPVTGATFRITDVDKDTDLWIDNIFVAPSGFVAEKGSKVIGAGTMADPFRSNVEGNAGSADPTAHVLLTWANPVQQLVINYQAVDEKGESANGQHIGIAGLGFNDC